MILRGDIFLDATWPWCLDVSASINKLSPKIVFLVVCIVAYFTEAPSKILYSISVNIFFYFIFSKDMLFKRFIRFTDIKYFQNI